MVTSSRKSAMLTSGGGACPSAAKCDWALAAGPENTMRPSLDRRRMWDSIAKMSERGW